VTIAESSSQPIRIGGLFRRGGLVAAEVVAVEDDGTGHDLLALRTSLRCACGATGPFSRRAVFFFDPVLSRCGASALGAAACYEQGIHALYRGCAHAAATVPVEERVAACPVVRWRSFLKPMMLVRMKVARARISTPVLASGCVLELFAARVCKGEYLVEDLERRFLKRASSSSSRRRQHLA